HRKNANRNEQYQKRARALYDHDEEQYDLWQIPVLQFRRNMPALTPLFWPGASNSINGEHKYRPIWNDQFRIPFQIKQDQFFPGLLHPKFVTQRLLRLSQDLVSKEKLPFLPDRFLL